MAIHWRVRFKSIGGTDYSVNIHDDSYAGDPVDLIGGAQPFTTSEDHQYDFLMPVRISTGSISVINTGDLSALLPMRPKDRFVTLTSGNTILWQGYIQQEQFSQPWDVAPYELTFPVVSALGILDGYQMQKGNVPDIARVAEYLATALTATGATYTTIVFPAEMGIQSGGPWDLLFRFGLQDINWFTYKNENLLDKTEPRFDGVSWLKFIEELMSAFGYTMYEHGTTIYIVSKTVSSYVSIPVSALQTLADNDPVTLTDVTRSTIQVSDMNIGGNDGKIDITLSSRRAIVEAGIKKFDADSTPQFDTKYLDYEGMVNIVREIQSTPGSYYFNEEVGVYGPISGQNIWTFRQFYNGNEVTWVSQDMALDYHMAALCRRKTSENVIIINYNSVSGGTGWGGDWTCAVKSASASFFAGGNMILRGRVDIYAGEGGSVYEMNRGKFMLRIGSYYYDASTDSWTTTPTTFGTILDESSHEIDATNSYNMGPDNGYYISIPDSGLYGDVELFIYDPYSTAGTVQQLEATFVLSGMSLEYAWPQEDVFKDYPVTDSNRFVENLNLFAQEDAEKDIMLTSFINNRMGSSVILKPDFSEPLGKIQSRNQGTVYFEQQLLRAITICYDKPTEVITIPVRQTSVFSPIDSYEWNGPHYYLSCETIWRDDLQHLRISKSL